MNGVSYKLNELIEKYAHSRYCIYADTIKAGVAQGCPLSMALFCAAIDPVIRKFATKYRLVAYADDILVGHSADISHKDVIKELKAELAKYGLAVSDRKCKSTADGGVIEYLGQEFKQEEPLTLGQRLK